MQFCYTILAMSPLAVIALLLLTGNSLLGKEFFVCLEDQSRMFGSDFELYKRLLRSAAGNRGMVLTFSCRATDAIRITIAHEPFQEEPSALGATRVAFGRLLPEVYVFRGAIRRTLSSALPVLEVRAMVLVALHELQHFADQRQDHDHDGVFSSSLGRVQLLAWSRDYR